MSFLLFFMLSWSTPAAAQTERGELSTPWVLAPPLWTYGPDGERSGFFIELAGLIADEIGHDLTIQTYGNLQEMIAAQNRGETDLVAGSVARAFLQENNVLSTPVGKTRIRLFVREGNKESFRFETARGQKIGTMQFTTDPEILSFLARNTVVSPTSTGQAVIRLLSGELDAIMYPEDAIVDWTMRSRIDHLVLPTADLFEEEDRAVVLHRSRAELLGPINAAIAKLEESGAIGSLRDKYGIELHDPVPEVLTVGFPLAPGYGAVTADGEPTGFMVELMTDLAERSGLNMQFEPMTLEELFDEQELLSKDLIGYTAETDFTRRSMDFTLPVEGVLVSLVVRNADSAKFTSLDDLAGQRLGVIEYTYSEG